MLVRTDLIPAGFDGITVWPFMFVRPARADNKGLIEHELVHYREQRWKTPVWWLRYLLSASFRQDAEVRAYRRQIAMRGISAGAAAHYLASSYRLDLSYTQALGLLMGET